MMIGAPACFRVGKTVLSVQPIEPDSMTRVTVVCMSRVGFSGLLGGVHGVASTRADVVLRL